MSERQGTKQLRMSIKAILANSVAHFGTKCLAVTCSDRDGSETAMANIGTDVPPPELLATPYVRSEIAYAALQAIRLGNVGTIQEASWVTFDGQSGTLHCTRCLAKSHDPAVVPIVYLMGRVSAFVMAHSSCVAPVQVFKVK